MLLLACIAVAWSGDLSQQQLLPAYRYFAALAPQQATLTVLPTREQRFELQANSPPQVSLSKHELALIEVVNTALTPEPRAAIAHRRRSVARGAAEAATH